MVSSWAGVRCGSMCAGTVGASAWAAAVGACAKPGACKRPGAVLLAMVDLLACFAYDVLGRTDPLRWKVQGPVWVSRQGVKLPHTTPGRTLPAGPSSAARGSRAADDGPALSEDSDPRMPEPFPRHFAGAALGSHAAKHRSRSASTNVRSLRTSVLTTKRLAPGYDKKATRRRPRLAAFELILDRRMRAGRASPAGETQSARQPDSASNDSAAENTGRTERPGEEA